MSLARSLWAGGHALLLLVLVERVALLSELPRGGCLALAGSAAAVCWLWPRGACGPRLCAWGLCLPWPVLVAAAALDSSQATPVGQLGACLGLLAGLEIAVWLVERGARARPGLAANFDRLVLGSQILALWALSAQLLSDDLRPSAAPAVWLLALPPYGIFEAALGRGAADLQLGSVVLLLGWGLWLAASAPGRLR